MVHRAVFWENKCGNCGYYQHFSHVPSTGTSIGREKRCMENTASGVRLLISALSSRSWLLVPTWVVAPVRGSNAWIESESVSPWSSHSVWAARSGSRCAHIRIVGITKDVDDWPSETHDQTTSDTIVKIKPPQRSDGPWPHFSPYLSDEEEPATKTIYLRRNSTHHINQMARATKDAY